MPDPRNPNQTSTSVKPARARRKTPIAAPPDTQPVKSTRDAPASAELTRITFSDRHSMIATAAYYRAEKRRFAPGFELEDWIAAESEVDELLTRGEHSP